MSYPAPRRKVWPWVLLGVALVFVALFAACTAFVGGAAVKATQERTITYSVKGTGNPTVSYWTGQGLSTEGKVTTPWSKDVQASGFDLTSLTVTLDQRGGSVTCAIVADDGSTISTQTASGPFGIASCSGH